MTKRNTRNGKLLDTDDRNYERLDLMTLKGQKLVDIRWENQHGDDNGTHALLLTFSNGERLLLNRDTVFDGQGMYVDHDTNVPIGKLT